MIIDRNADYNDIDALTMTADNVWCAGIVLGNPIDHWEILTLIKQNRLYWNDEEPQNAFIKFNHLKPSLGF